MKRKVLITLGILSICLFASACGSDTASTEQSTENTEIVQETETEKVAIAQETEVKDTETQITETQEAETETEVQDTENTETTASANNDDEVSDVHMDTSEIDIMGTKNESAEINNTWEGGVGGFTEYARSQGADETDGWCWIYNHGEGAGDEPTYAVYMKEGDPNYGKVYYVGDYLPSGTQLYGTDEETDVFMREEMKRIAEEDGYEVTVDEDGSYVIHLYD